MDAYNLAIMFGPALVRPKDDTMVNMLRDMADQGQIVENLIKHVSSLQRDFAWKIIENYVC